MQPPQKHTYFHRTNSEKDRPMKESPPSDCHKDTADHNTSTYTNNLPTASEGDDVPIISCTVAHWLDQKTQVPFLIWIGGFLTSFLWPSCVDLYYLLFRSRVIDDKALDALKDFGWLVLILIILILVLYEKLETQANQRIRERKGLSDTIRKGEKSHLIRILIEALFLLIIATTYIILLSAGALEWAPWASPASILYAAMLFGIISYHIHMLACVNSKWRLELYLCEDKGKLFLLIISLFLLLALATYAEAPCHIQSPETNIAVLLLSVTSLCITLFELLWFEFAGSQYSTALHSCQNAFDNQGTFLASQDNSREEDKHTEESRKNNLTKQVAILLACLTLFAIAFLGIIYLMHP